MRLQAEIADDKEDLDAEIKEAFKYMTEMFFLNWCSLNVWQIKMRYLPKKTPAD